MNARAACIAAALLCAAPLGVSAQDAMVAAALSAGTVGEGADGYLALRGGGGADLKARVDQINIKRRAAYTDLAVQRGVSVQDVAAAAACQVHATIPQGGWWRNEAGSWIQRGAGAFPKPGWCG
ncbi:MAG: YdbL family protein [Sphingomonadaceae bacterium]|nr:YdbL family protein [Sphingomonadaceae bacterium]